MNSNLIDWVSVFSASHLNAEECRDVASKFYDEAKKLDRRTAMKLDNTARSPRYETQETDYHWDKCYGVYDHRENRFVMRDPVKRHCNALATDLNLALDLECEAGKASVDRYISDT